MILVTGATGHIGNVLVRELLACGESVRALVLPDEEARPLRGLPVERAAGDVCDPDALARALEGVEAVYHLAAVISIMPGQRSRLREINTLGTMHVIRAARTAGVRRMVYASSIHAIRRIPHGLTIDETVPYDPDHALSAYDRSKAEGSLAVLQAVQGGLDAVIVCPTGVIGPYDFRRSEMGHIILGSMKNGLQFCMEGAYDFVDVRDVARGMVRACETGRRGETYILSGERVRLADLMQLAQEAAGSHPLRIQVPAAFAHLAARFAPLFYRITGRKPLFTPYALETVGSNSFISHEKASRELNYTARPIGEVVADTVRWFQENPQAFFAAY